MASLYSEYIGEKEFIDIDPKKAYLAACKWLAQNVYSNPDFMDKVTVKVQKIQNKKKTRTKFLVKIYCSIDEGEVKRKYCLNCQTFASILYSVESPKCESCKLQGYRKTLQNEIVNMKEWIRKGIEENEKWN